MESRTCCAHNVSKGCQLSSKVTVVERPDQPLTLMRLLVEGLGFKAETSLWLNPLRSAPMLVRPFPFDLVYLDKDRRVIEAVELLPEVPFPRFDPRVASALILPVGTISSTGTQKNDELILCSREELDFLLGAIAAPSIAACIDSPSVPTTASGAAVRLIAEIEAAKPVSNEMEPEPEVSDPPLVASSSPSAIAQMEPVASASVNAVPVAPASKPSTVPFLTPPLFGPVQSNTVAGGSSFTVALTTTWQVASSTTAAVLPDHEIGVAPEEDPAVSTSSTVLEPEQEVGIEDRLLREELSTRLSESVEWEKEADDVREDSATVEARAAESESVETQMQQAGPAEPVVDVGAAHELIPPTNEKSAPSPVVETGSKNKRGLRIADPGDSLDAGPIGKVENAQSPAAIIETTEAPKGKREHRREKWAGIDSEDDLDATKPHPLDKKQKKSFGYRVKEFLNCPDPPPELRSATRLVQQGMIAYEKGTNGSDPMEVRDVSPTGLYLRTKKRWKPGKMVALTLERKGAREHEYNSRVDVQARIMRRDEDGVGLSWVFPDGITFNPWQRLHTKRSEESDIQFFIREVRLARAMGVLLRICPLAAEEVRHALHDRLSSKRVASAVEIVLQAEDSLIRNGDASKVLAHPDVVMRIIESGSWIEDNWIRTLWSGLLVSACSPDGQDTANLIFIDLLARLTPVHLRILSFVCKKADKALSAGVTAGSLDISCTAKELTEAADSQSFARIQQTIGQLSTAGLLVESARPSYVSVMDKVKTTTTPTVLGLKMHARCNGIRMETP